MKSIISTIFLILFLTGCSTINLTKNSIEPKDKLIQKADNGNIQAMLMLNKHYNFPYTKEGLYYFNKWYKTIDKNDNTQDINNIAKIYYKYKDMFINGEMKVLKLYELSASLGNLNANIAQIDIFVTEYKPEEEIKKIENKIFNLLNEEQLNQLYNIYKDKYYYLKNRVRIIDKMTEKGYKIPFHNTLEKIKQLVNQKSKIDLLNTLINEVITQQNPKNIYELGYCLQKVYGQTENPLYIYKKLLKIDPSNDKIYVNMALIYSKKSYIKEKKKNKALALKFYEKASLLGNKKAAKKLLTLYSKNLKDVDKFFTLKNRLLKTKEGQLIVAKYYYKKKLYIKSNQILEKLAKEGNQEAILNLALIVQSSYNFDPDVHKTIQKWRKFIETSNNSELETKYIYKLLKYKYKKDIRNTLLKYIQKNIKRIDILTLRKLAASHIYTENKKALYYYNKAIEAGDKKSTLELAKFYLYSSKYKDFNKAIALYSILTKKGDVSAIKTLASFYLDPPRSFKKFRDVKKGLAYYEDLAKKGNISAMKELAKAYICKECYDGKAIDYKRGLIYLKKVEDLENGRYSASIAWLYNTGKGVKQDLIKAKKYYEKARKQGYYSANYYLAWLYYKDKNSTIEPIKLDYKKALEYLEEGAKHNHHGCINLLGLFYEKGYGVKKDLAKTASYYKKMASYDNMAAYWLGSYYKNKKDYKNAEKYFTFAAKERNSAAMVHLGIIYEKGLSGKVDIKKAIDSYKEAYNQNKDKSAAYNLGLIYQYGKGNIKKDLNEAKSWYLKSTHKLAKKQLALVNKKIHKTKK